MLDYLLEVPGGQEKWLNANQEEIRKEFKPVDVRKALDKRDGFKKSGRLAHCRMLSTLGAHPTPLALNLKRDGMKLIRSGPFHHIELFVTVLAENHEDSSSAF